MAPMNNVMPTGSAYASDTTDVVIPPQGYALLENYNPSGKSFAGVTANPNDALYRSASSGLSATGVWTGPTNVTTNVNANNTVDVWVTGLSNVIADSVGGGGGSSLGGEFYLLRPRRADGTFTSSTDPLNNFSETGVGGVVNLYDLVPVDSYDFSNLLQTGPGASTYNLWSYIRSKGALTGQAPLLFKGTYPGYYNPIAIQRFTGTVAPQGLVTPPTMTVPTVTPAFGQYSTACYADNFPPIQVYPVGATANMHFPNAVITQGTTPLAPPTATAPPLKFPFGGFARNGDMLDIPFVGSYRIRLTSAIAATPQEFVELNSLPIDCAMAAIDDGKPAASTIDTAENIGRFMPMRASQYYNSQIAAGGFAAPIPPDFYSWT
jgi:hypothetical protein